LGSKASKETIRGMLPASIQVSDASDAKVDERFWVLSGSNVPRWIIPQDTRHGSHVFRCWKPYGLISQVKWRILYAFYRIGLLGWIPGVTSVGISGFASEQSKYLSVGCESTYVPSFYIGTIGITQKIVVSFIDPHINEVISVVKIPLGGGASANIIHEYSVLSALEKSSFKLSPTPYSIDLALGCSSQEAIRGGLVGRIYSDELNVFLSRLLTKNKVSIRDKARVLSKKIQELDGCVNDELLILLGVLSDLQDTTQLPAYYVHGDFVPWNIIETGGGVIAVDWEMSDLYGLPLYDFYYFHFQQEYLFKCFKKVPKPYGDLILGLSNHIINDLRRYTLVAMAYEYLNVGRNVSFFIKKLKAEEC